MTAIDGDWAGALGALVLFATNLLAMIVVGAALFSSLAAVREHRSDPESGAGRSTASFATASLGDDSGRSRLPLPRRPARSM